MDTKKVWFVTGASKGLGLTLVKELLKEGHRVAATSRNAEDLQLAIGENTENFLPLAMDLKNERQVALALKTSHAYFGKLDVVVNNAGYGLVGSLEELSDGESHENFEVNVFGTLNVIRKAMPYFRKQRSGHIINISSIGGFTGNFPGFGIYCATKFAIEGLSEALAAEVKPFGVQATIIAPGYFRTNFLAPDSLQVPENEILEYKEVRDTQRLHQHEIDGKQAGDPVKAAKVMIKIGGEPNAPLRLFLGEDAYQLAQEKISSLAMELEKWKELTLSTAFEAVV
ncbi:oxidoreductase [Pedobacter nutrimenti]|uniref:NADP-dependent 3-hydroxy acid dehydrogenase YdfG n=1 Tax=Pedobacter nutrimenti TaxID=1241337 RepID=A0A318U9N4_9SPHI|nr:oxidoreductase [Pedobacter nutrimenti]PYF71493.1 NADP-dependent 3-hydroxy acid dehydrogenase YdfG [Pedobacter nutrimenti]